MGMVSLIRNRTAVDGSKNLTTGGTIPTSICNFAVTEAPWLSVTVSTASNTPVE